LSSTGWGSNSSGGSTWSGWYKFGEGLVEFFGSDDELDGLKGSTSGNSINSGNHNERVIASGFISISGGAIFVSSLSHRYDGIGGGGPGGGGGIIEGTSGEGTEWLSRVGWDWLEHVSRWPSITGLTIVNNVVGGDGGGKVSKGGWDINWLGWGSWGGHGSWGIWILGWAEETGGWGFVLGVGGPLGSLGIVGSDLRVIRSVDRF